VTFTITVQNTSAVDDVTINSVIDNQFGDISGFCTPQLPATLAPSQSVTCTITEFVSGDVGQTFTNVATGSGEDDDGNPVSDDDSADVTFNDVPPAASLTKTASMVVATFDVVVTNGSAVEDLTLDELSDDVFGNITTVQGNVLSTTCSVPQTIAVGGSYSCTFDGKVNSSPHTDTVTGTLSDNEGGQVTPSDSANVTFQ
jgi:hypothetical protein